MRRLDTKIFIDQQPRTKSKTKAKRLFLPFGFPVLPVLHLTPPLLLALVLPGLQDLLRPLDLVPGPLPVLRHGFASLLHGGMVLEQAAEFPCKRNQTSFSLKIY